MKRLLLFLLITLLQLRLVAQEMPIVAFHGVKPAFTDVKHFKQLRDAGFNVNLTVYPNNEEAAKALDCAHLAGVKILLLTPELFSETAKTVKRFQNHPAMFGYFIADEPSLENLSNVVEKIKEIQRYDSILPAYVNLFPNYADEKYLKANNYEQYVSAFTHAIPGHLISFDNYPLMGNRIHEKWYENLEIIRKHSMRESKQFWGFANSTVFHAYEQPTEAGLRLQQFSNLLYGAQGLQYFTYWTLDDEYWKKNNFQHAMVDSYGKPTITYDLVKNVNNEIEKYSSMFYGARINSVYHMGKYTPAGTQKFTVTSVAHLKVNGDALISVFENKGKKYLAVLNKSLQKKMRLTMKKKKSMFLVRSEDEELPVASGNVFYKLREADVLVFRFQ